MHSQLCYLLKICVWRTKLAIYSGVTAGSNTVHLVEEELEKGKNTINLYKAGNRRLSLAVVGGIKEIYKQIIPTLFCFSIFMTNVTVPHKNSQPYKHCPMLTLSDKEQ